MGVIINETITLSNGLTVTDPYASLFTNDIRIEKRVEKVSTTTKYILDGCFSMWVNKDMRNDDKGSIGSIPIRLESTTPFTGNVYDTLYNKLKTMKTCTDAV
jgi:hypothetical protein